MITIRTLVGRRLNYVNGIYRRQIELDRYLMTRNDVKLEYYYYDAPLNPLDYLTKRYVLYPYHCSRKLKEENGINHLTFQYLGDLGHFLEKDRTIITCHDIFTFLERSNLKNPYPVQIYALSGLKKCRFIISISEFTKKELNLRFRIPSEKIIVIKNGINSEIFKPFNENEMNQLEPLYPGYYKILHVGTEEIRKNFPTLLKAF